MTPVKVNLTNAAQMPHKNHDFHTTMPRFSFEQEIYAIYIELILIEDLLLTVSPPEFGRKAGIRPERIPASKVSF